MNSMDNFFRFVTKPIGKDEVDVWFAINNIIGERAELFQDFCESLVGLIKETYFGEDRGSDESKISMTDSEKVEHFNWCWIKTINRFKLEKIYFSDEGEHYDYFKQFFWDVYYNQNRLEVRESIEGFFVGLFDRHKTFTKSDLEIFTELYKVMNKNLSIVN